MKAIRVHQFGDPDVMKLEDAPDLRAGAGEVVVQTRAIGVNPVETYVRAGIYGARPFPFTPGTDAAGDVLHVGEDVNGVQVGGRVYVAFGAGLKCSGTYAEQVLCDSRLVFPLPDNLTFAQGAALGVPYATAWRALFDIGQAKSGDTLLIHGASGGVGIAATQIARAYGLKVLGTAGTRVGLQLVKEQGAHEVFDHTQRGHLSDVLGYNCGAGVDLILEMRADINLGQDLGVLARGGRVVIVGSRGPVEVNPRELMSRDAQVRGMSLFNASPNEIARVHEALRPGLQDGTLRPIIQEELPLSQAARAHERVLEGGSGGKIVLVPDGS